MKRARGFKDAAEIARLRLRNQRLVGTPLQTPEEVVGWLGAVQSQDYYGAKWAIAQRLASGEDAPIEAAFERGTILRTHVLRPTWHFVLPEDVRWLLALTAPRVRMLLGYYDKKLAIDAALLRRVRAVLTRTLEGRVATREQLGQALAEDGIEARGQRLGHLLAHAELDALICSGPRQGKQFTYALLDARAPATPPKERDDALGELARRYFASHGPALVHDFAWWSGLTVADATRGIELAKLEARPFEDKAYWFAPRLAAAGRVRFDPPQVHLLPNYDEQVASFKDYRPAFDPARVEVPRNAEGALMNHIIVSNGQIVGGWKRTIAKDHVRIDARLLARLTGVERAALVRAVERYGEYLGMPARLHAKAVKSLARMGK